MAACCCCTCNNLNALIECDAITIEGFSRIGDWINLTPYTGCCWRGFFGADNCQYTGPFCYETPCNIAGFGDNTITSKRGVEYYLYRGCLREVWIWRDFYSRYWATENSILDCNDQLGCSYFILTRWVDYAKIIEWQQMRTVLNNPVPDFLSTCPIGNCFSEDQCEWTTGDVQYRCRQCTCNTDWWRIRHFRQLPTGTVTFGPTDNDPCDLDFLRCVPDRVPGFPESGKLAHFNTTTRCCGAISPYITGSCNCELWAELFCNSATPGYVEIPPLCFSNPDSWSIEIGTCE